MNDDVVDASHVGMSTHVPEKTPRAGSLAFLVTKGVESCVNKHLFPI